MEQVILNTRDLDEQRYLYQRTFARVEIVECAAVVGEASHRELYVPTVPELIAGTVLRKQRMLLVKWVRIMISARCANDRTLHHVQPLARIHQYIWIHERSDGIVLSPLVFRRRTVSRLPAASSWETVYFEVLLRD